MKTSHLRIRYKAAMGQPMGTDMRSYRIDEWDGIRLLRSFTMKISGTQKAIHQATESAVERWCELKSDKLPMNGGTINVELNEVQIL
jgi:hypothetical protein